jgi:electron transfer flavoprotein alpha subunit
MSVIVYTENWDAKFKKQSFELISYARKVADDLQTEVKVVSIGEVEKDELTRLGQYGADTIFSYNHELLKNLNSKLFCKIIADVATDNNARVIILANNITGKAIAPRLSVKLKAGVVSGVVELPSSYEPFIVKKKIFNGKAYSNTQIYTDIKVLTLFQNSFEIQENPKDAEIVNIDYPVDASDIKAEVLETNKVQGKILLNDAEIVVSGGRGMKGPEHWEHIEQLAELLGAATACSRPVSDEGWRPHEEHTGQTGKIIAPNLYIAAGISGAIQHLAGVSSSKIIVAVNKDHEAPIFEAADYGIVGDVHKVLPELIEAVKKLKEEA